MSFYDATALRPQAPSQSSYEYQWAKYFSRVIDDCQASNKIDFIDRVYEHWAQCINSGEFSAAISDSLDD